MLYGVDCEHKIVSVRKYCYDLVKEYQLESKSYGHVYPSNEPLITQSPMEASHIGREQRQASFEIFISQSTSTDHVKSELDYYLEEFVMSQTDTFDILGWWKMNGSKYPTLCNVARDILAIHLSTVASESVFSTSGRFVTPHHSRLRPNTLEALMCCQDWLLAEDAGTNFYN